MPPSPVVRAMSTRLPCKAMASSSGRPAGSTANSAKAKSSRRESRGDCPAWSSTMESVIGKFLQFPEGFGDPLLQGRSQFLLKDPGSQGGHAALAAEIGFAQGDCAEMDLAS